MSNSRNKIAFVIATKDRPSELRSMLESLEVQSYHVGQLIIVDGGNTLVDGVVQQFPNLNITYLRCIPPSATKQRNMGLNAVDSEITLIGFLDDDIILKSDALQKMMDFWKNVPEDIGGVAFNMINHPQLYASWIKSLPLTEKLGLYSKDGGKVLPSGFHTMIGYVTETTFVQWLPTTAVIWRRRVLENFQFDEWFNGYSYLEDLDFSYRIGKKHKLAVAAEAQYSHYPSSSGRVDYYTFGKKEVFNRIHFIKKNRELSLLRCYIALSIRILLDINLSISEGKVGYFRRAWGKCIGLLQVFTSEV